MVRWTWGCVGVLLALSLAACDDPSPDAAPVSPAPAATSAGWTAPPLQLPTVGPGDPCPVTEPRPWSDSDLAHRVLGPGPLYPVADYFPDGALQLRDEDREPDGTYTKKVRWVGSGYTGPVLVRAARIDAPGSAGVRFSYTGESRDDGYYAVLSQPDSDLPATTTVSGPGCYAYQVDGASFGVTVVFRAVPATSPPS
ncbi:hypothetical protein [Verrucosispora sp. WMMC514]|uniref:hypothetical protein n=1 Tax=Verrucosispora sp. WMMC514 TaxID=3015156 RepID=UPI00248AFE23|nr:hypothetical protein [Verrucosispora sp. WMMC514]WBB93222.1 hypothetical protein O7597_09735 [Verrucosispora sp. WMMC514]